MLHSLYNCGEKMALESGKQQRVRRSRALIFLKEEEGAQNFIYFSHKQNPVHIYPHPRKRANTNG